MNKFLWANNHKEILKFAKYLLLKKDVDFVVVVNPEDIFSRFLEKVKEREGGWERGREGEREREKGWEVVLREIH